MSGFERLATWVSENEALFSGLAALVALAALVPAALGPVLRKRRASMADDEPGRKSRKSIAKSGERPRLAVFPFEAVRDDDLATTADIVTDELTALLARAGGCEVISRRSTAAVAERGVTASDAGRELEVRYVVEGQLRPAGDGLRVGASLVDTARSRVVWSDSFTDAKRDGDEVALSLAERIASHLGIEVTRAEVGHARTRPKSRAARDLTLRAQGVLFDRGHSRASYAEATDLLEQAITKDPEYAEAHAFFGLLVGLGNIFGFFDVDRRSHALAAAKRAIEIDDRSSDVLGYAGCAYCDMRQYELGMPLLDRAIDINPSNAQAKAALGTAQIGLKQFESGVETLEDALRITPAYKGIAPWATVLASGYINLGRLEDASASIETALACDPTFFPAHLSAAVVAALQEDSAKAERHVREAKRINPALDATVLASLVGRRAAGVLIHWIG